MIDYKEYEETDPRLRKLNIIQKIDAIIWAIFFFTGIPIYIYEEFFDSSDNGNYVGIILFLIFGAILAITMVIFVILDLKIKKLKGE